MSLTLRAFAAATVLAVVTALGGAPALAHTEVTDVSPAADSVVAEGTVVTITFSVAVLDIGAEAVVTDAAGTATALPVSFPSTQSVAVTMPALAEGAVSLAWRVVADDGHPVEGVLTYSAAAPPSPLTTPSPSVSPSADAASATPTASPTPSLVATASAEQTEGDGGGVPVAVWVAVGAALIAAFAVTLAARRK